MNVITKKIEMSQIFDDTGAVRPVTWVSIDAKDLESLKEGETIKVVGTSNGKGFQGVVKRHGFHGGPRTHGQKHSEREPGSIGATWPQRVLRGKRMAGRMGGERVTVSNLEIVKILPEKNLVAISGAVPGHRGSIVEIRTESTEKTEK